MIRTEIRGWGRSTMKSDTKIRIILFILILGSVVGCSTIPTEPQMYMQEPIHVPLHYQISSQNESPGIPSDAERYTSMYDTARWLVIQEYVKNIDSMLSKINLHLCPLL